MQWNDRSSLLQSPQFLWQSCSRRKRNLTHLHYLLKNTTCLTISQYLTATVLTISRYTLIPHQGRLRTILIPTPLQQFYWRKFLSSPTISLPIIWFQIMPLFIKTHSFVFIDHQFSIKDLTNFHDRRGHNFTLMYRHTKWLLFLGHSAINGVPVVSKLPGVGSRLVTTLGIGYQTATTGFHY